MKRLETILIYFLGLCLGVGLSGCETSLDLPNSNESRLTIISHLAPDGWDVSKVYVYVSQSPLESTHFHTPSFLEVDVTEVESSTTIRLDSVRNGNELYFIFPDGFLKAGFTYSVSAACPGYETVNATTVIPQPSTISNLHIQDIKIEPSDKNEFKNIVRYKLIFDINHAESNRYYHLVFYNKYQGIDTLYILDPELSDEQPFLKHYDFGVLIDKEDLTLDQPLFFYFVDWVVENNDLERVYVELRSITDEYYKYHSSLARQLIVRQDPFAEPVIIFNNINGGYGNFSGFTNDISSSDLPQ